MGQNESKADGPPIIDIEHSSIENDDKHIYMVCKDSGTDKCVAYNKTMPSKPVPILKHTENKYVPPPSPSSVPLNQGPTKVKRLFRRHSSMRVCPDHVLIDTSSAPNDPVPSDLHNALNDPVPSTSNPASPAGTNDKNKNVFLFNGILSPVPLPQTPEAEEGFLTVTQLYNTMNDGQVCPYLFDPTYILIIDTRVRDDYTHKHIVTARWVGDLNHPLPIEPLELYTMVILYDHKGLSHTVKGSKLNRTVREIQSQGIDPFILVGGFESFYSTHPYLCTSKVPRSEAERQSLIVPFPSIVLENQLWLGRGDQATCHHIITSLQITHVVNVTKDHRLAFPKRIKYLQIELDDDLTANLLPEFPGAVKFISDAITDGGRVLVHCNRGISRSSTVVIAFLMYTRRWTLKDARLFLKERRPIIHPNNTFYYQLSKFEEILFGKKFTNIREL